MNRGQRPMRLVSLVSLDTVNIADLLGDAFESREHSRGIDTVSTQLPSHGIKGWADIDT